VHVEHEARHTPSVAWPSVESRSVIRHVDGHGLELMEIDQWLVYEGLFNQEPTVQLNQQLVAAAVEGAGGRHRPVALVGIAGERSGSGFPETSGTAEPLPKIGVRARFISQRVARVEGEFSELTVVWFQEAWALPIAPSAVEAIARLDWDALARDMTW